MTPTQEAVMRQALEALENASDIMDSWAQKRQDDAIAALRAALAEPVQEPVHEPVAWVVYDSDQNDIVWSDAGKRLKAETPLYTAPQRKPLTEVEIKVCEKQAMVNGALPFEQRVFFARAIETMHGIR